MYHYVSNPRPDFKVKCPYCFKEMDFVGPERAVKKKWLKLDIKSAKELNKTDHPLYVCPDKECSGVYVVDAWNCTGMIIKPGIYGKVET